MKLMKHLGVYLDDVLSFDQHIEFLYDKAVKSFVALAKVNKCINHSTALTP